jgi:hypothetical protein
LAAAASSLAIVASSLAAAASSLAIVASSLAAAASSLVIVASSLTAVAYYEEEWNILAMLLWLQLTLSSPSSNITI